MTRSTARGRRIATPLTCLSAAVLLAACGGTGDDGGGGDGGEAEGAITLRLSEGVPVTHFAHQEFTIPFIDSLESASAEDGCPIEIDVFADAQLGQSADTVDDLNSGVFDLGQASPAYNADQMPLGDAYNLPGLVADPVATTAAYYDTSQDKESELYQYDFERNDLVPIGVFTLPSYQLVTTAPIEGVDAFEGLNIRSAGGVQDAVVEALGGTPVQLAANEQYEGFQRGILDGAVFNLPGIISNRTFEVTDYFTTNADVSGYVSALSLSRTRWEGLSTCQQDALLAAGKEATEQFGQGHAERKDAVISELEENGMQAVEFTPDQLDELADRLDGVADQWAEDMEDRGAPGEAALAEARAAVEDNS